MTARRTTRAGRATKFAAVVRKCGKCSAKRLRLLLGNPIVFTCCSPKTIRGRRSGRGRPRRLPFPTKRGASMPPPARIKRDPGEPKTTLAVDLDGTGRAELRPGVGFFDHMLPLLARHSLIDLTVEAAGDLHVDAH